MRTIVLFFLFFIIFPLFIGLLHATRDLLAGPRDDSLLSKQLYEQRARQAAVEIIISLLVVLVLAGWYLFIFLPNQAG